MATSAMTAIAPATGPLNDCCKRVNGASQGSACPPPAANEGKLKTTEPKVSEPVRISSHCHARLLLNDFICSPFIVKITSLVGPAAHEVSYTNSSSYLPSRYSITKATSRT